MKAVTDLINHILDAHVVTIGYLLFMAVGVEQVIAGKLTYESFLHSTPAALATAGVAIARGLAVYKRG